MVYKGEKVRRRSAIFLDRDGTIIEDNGDLGDISQVEFFDDTIPALKRLVEYYSLFIVTNQSGVAKGNIDLGDVHRINTYVNKTLSSQGIEIAETYVCPHMRSDDCSCIKPKPYFIQKAVKDYEIDAASSYVLGDHPHDITFAENAGANGIYLLTGHGKRHLKEIEEDCFIAAGIKEAADRILLKL